MEYQVDLEAFRGPLDLLLYLVKRDEVDICDIPIAQITAQYLQYISVLNMIDVEWAGEFLVMASTLMEIKSRMLLPRGEELDVEKDDPRNELVKQLMEYKKFRDAARLLEDHAQRQLQRLPRQPVEQPQAPAPGEQPIRKVELWDLVSAFGRLLRETTALQPQQIVMDETPIHIHMRHVLDVLRQLGPQTFAALFVPPHTRGRLLGLFLAILELIKGRQVVAEQTDLFGPITVALAAQDNTETGGAEGADSPDQ